MKLQNNKWKANIETKIRRDGSEHTIEREHKFFDRGWTHTKHIGRHGNRKPRYKDVHINVIKYFDDSDVDITVEVVFKRKPSSLAETIADCIVNDYKYDMRGNKIHRFQITDLDVSDIMYTHKLPCECVSLSDIKLALEECRQIKSVYLTSVQVGPNETLELLAINRD